MAYQNVCPANDWFFVSKKPGFYLHRDQLTDEQLEASK